MEGRVRSDEDLMSVAGRGDSDAFEELVRRHQHGAVGIAYRLLGDEHRAQDAAQEAFLRVWEHADTYRPTAAFRTYLYRILTRLCIDQRRKRRPTTGEPMDAFPATGDLPDDALERRERAVLVRAALGRLPGRQHVAIVLRHYEALSYEEIGAVMHCSARAVDSMLLRARRRLSEWLDDVR